MVDTDQEEGSGTNLTSRREMARGQYSNIAELLGTPI